jgi:methylamine utilization protein MauE
VTEGIALALAFLLVSAGLPKLWRPEHVAGALRRVFWRQRVATPVLNLLGQLLGLWELMLAGSLLMIGGLAVGLVVAGTFLGFLGFVVAAVRRGASCGCWASLTEGPAGGAELARTGTLTAGAGCLAVAGWSLEFAWADAGWAAAFLAVTWLAAIVGGRVAPVRSARVARRLSMRAAPTRRGRAMAWLAFLLGFVHAGTAAQRRRYIDALTTQQAAARRAPAGRPAPRRGPSEQGSESAQNASA